MISNHLQEILKSLTEKKFFRNVSEIQLNKHFLLYKKSFLSKAFKNILLKTDFVFRKASTYENSVEPSKLDNFSFDLNILFLRGTFLDILKKIQKCYASFSYLNEVNHWLGGLDLFKVHYQYLLRSRTILNVSTFLKLSIISELSMPTYWNHQLFLNRCCYLLFMSKPI